MLSVFQILVLIFKIAKNGRAGGAARGPLLFPFPNFAKLLARRGGVSQQLGKIGEGKKQAR